MCAYLLQMCVFAWALTVMGGTQTNAAKVTVDRGFEPVGNELFSNSGMNNKKKLKGTGIKLHNSIFKSKVEVLGEVLKKHVNRLRKADSKQVELVFLMDSSASVGAENFESEVKFVQKLLSDFTVSENTTRVSVIAYSSPGSVVRHVDHMTSPSHNNHKCGLLHHELPNIKYIGGGTYTRGALLEAQSVLKHARKNSTQALFLITDGFSNGGDPLPVAYELKEQGVTIFTFGIHNGNTKELYDMASQPGEEYSYILDSFGEFEAMVRRALHEDLKAGSYQVLGNSSHCNSRCDKLASCSCGTHTGHFACLCPPGYYGSGLSDTCKLCPNGTYSLGLVPGDVSICQSCPDKRHVTVAPATSAKDCHCKNGLVSTGTYCKTATCPNLSAPQGGYFVTKSCGNVVNTACEMSCRMGYKLTGSRKRLCLDDGTWSGKETKCIARSCAPMKSPKNGDVSCNSDNYVVDTDCDFSCHPGYSLTGSRQRNCLPTARWDGLPTSCKPILCPPLPEVPNSVMSQDNCTTRQQLYGTHCNITCQSGYQLKGPKSRTCGSLGRWSGQNINFCEDVTPPDILCPEDIVVPSLPGEDYATVNWKIMSVSDNSGLPPKLWTKPSTRQPMTVKIGNRTITYIASDASQLRSKCDFTITVEDEEPPVIHSCESPPPFLLDTGDNSSLVWDPPVFEDNSGFPIQVSRSPDTDKFPFGTTPVTYIASDASGNTAKCVLNITVEENVCVEPSGLHHGHVNCSTNVESLHCTLTCDEGYAFAMQHRDYFCTYDSDGSVLAPDNSIDPFPDCSLTVLPNSLSQEGTIILEGNGTVCEDEDFLSQLEDDLREKIAEGLAGICSTEVSCSVEDVSASCDQVLSGLEEESNVLSRKKRHAQKMSNVSRVNEAVYVPDTHSLLRGNKINLRFQMKSQSKQRNNTAQANNQHLQLNINKMKDAVRLATRKGTLFNVISTPHRRRQMRVKEVELKKAPMLVCDAGSVLKGKVCVLCPLGTYWNLTSKACESCPIGSYQPYEGSIRCLACPPGTSTRKIHAKSMRDCHPLCPPGSFGRKRKQWQSAFPGLAPCRSCDYGSYQYRAGQTECWRCPGNWTTLRRGSTRLDDCKAPCPSGEISRTGLVPCVKCPPGYSQPYSRQKLCYSDTGGESIGVECVFLPCQNRGMCHSLAQDYFLCDCPPGFVGSLCEQVLKGCDTDPCLHGATCVDTAPMQYMCICSHGYLGDRCELEVDECLSDPCQNGATCIDRVNSFLCVCADGFQGTLCEENIDDCSMKPCVHNATCFDSRAGYSCVCPKGYSGRLCEMEPLDSCRDEPCYNNAICISEASEYRCLCAEGFEGVHCEINTNDCNTSLCENGGTCVDLVEGYECTCLPKFSGRHCEIDLPSEYFLHFPSSGTTDYVLLRGPSSPLSQVSVCFWLKSADSFNYGTVFSYATNFSDNTFTLTDYNGFVLYINGERIVTDITANDGFWHSVCVMWESTDGAWSIYLDGKPGDNGTGLANGSHIPGGGVVILGQEQDTLGSGFSEAESFTGHLSSLAIWDHLLQDIQIWDLTTRCGRTLSSGNLFGWTDFLHGIHGNLKIENSSFCSNCAELQVPFQGSVNVTGSVAIYTCNSGFYLKWNGGEHDMVERKCLKQGIWEGLAPICVRKSCGFPGYFPRGVMLGRSYRYKDVIRYQCNTGYKQVGTAIRVCMANGKWSGEVPVCQGKVCDEVAAPLNGRLKSVLVDSGEVPWNNSIALQYGHQVELECEEGFHLEGSNFLTCLEDGQWDEPIPTCQALGCKNPPVVSNGYLKTTPAVLYAFGTRISYECQTGYKIQQLEEVICGADGKWHGEVQCNIVECTPPAKLENGKIFKQPLAGDQQFVYNSSVTATCNVGFKLVGPSVLYCLVNGTWSLGQPRCERVSCDILQLPEDKNGNLSISGNHPGDWAFFYCVPGHRLSLSAEATHIKWMCHDSETWVNENPNVTVTRNQTLCVPHIYNCDEPKDPENGYILREEPVKNYTIGRVLKLKCRLGYTLQGSNISVCQEGGVWSHRNVTCAPVQCESPPAPHNTDLENSAEVYVYGNMLNFRCNEGYQAYGVMTSRCLANAKWSRVRGKCARISCGKPPVNNGATILGNSYLYQDQVVYNCPTGMKVTANPIITCLSNGTWSGSPTCENI